MSLHVSLWYMTSESDCIFNQTEFILKTKRHWISIQMFSTTSAGNFTRLFILNSRLFIYLRLALSHVSTYYKDDVMWNILYFAHLLLA